MNEPVFYYKLSFIYKDMNDIDNLIKCLKKAIGAKENFWPAYQELGEIYFNDGYLLIAKEMFEKAVQYGGGNREWLQKSINAIGNSNVTMQYDVMFDQATILMGKGECNYALELYGFLLNKNYSRTVDIYMNIGIYNFKINNLEEALKYFQEAKENKKSAGIYAYIAYTYYKLGQPKKALDTLNEGMQSFGNDPQLVNLYMQIEQAEKKEK